MAITASAQSGAKFDPIPAGLHHAICYGIIDVGTQPSNNPQFKPSRKVVFLFELPDERINIDGKDLPRGTSTKFTLSLGDKSKLRPALQSWRGRPFTDEELKGFDITKVLGANAYVNITHETKDGKTYANVTTINPLPKGMAKRTPENALVQWTFDEQPPGPIVPPEGIPGWIAELITKSHEYQARLNEPAPTPAQSAGGGAGSSPSIDENDDQVPF
jgi:hypothetical protein